jgi:hypothetical protein
LFDCIIGGDSVFDVGKTPGTTLGVLRGAVVVPFSAVCGGDTLGERDGAAFLSTVGSLDVHWEGDEDVLVGAPRVGTGVALSVGVLLADDEGPTLGWPFG